MKKKLEKWKVHLEGKKMNKIENLAKRRKYIQNDVIMLFRQNLIQYSPSLPQECFVEMWKRLSGQFLYDDEIVCKFEFLMLQIRSLKKI